MGMPNAQLLHSYGATTVQNGLCGTENLTQLRRK